MIIAFSMLSLFENIFYENISYSQTCPKDHLYIKTFCRSPGVYYAIDPTYQDDLCIRTTFCRSLGWSITHNFYCTSIYTQDTVAST